MKIRGEGEGERTLYMSPPVLEQVRTCCPSELNAKSRPLGTWTFRRVQFKVQSRCSFYGPEINRTTSGCFRQQKQRLVRKLLSNIQ